MLKKESPMTVVLHTINLNNEELSWGKASYPNSQGIHRASAGENIHQKNRRTSWLQSGGYFKGMPEKSLGFFYLNVNQQLWSLFLMQVQADIINAPVNRPVCVETTAMGAAYLAGLAVGYWKNKDEVVSNWAIDRTFSPSISEEERSRRISGWNKAVTYAYGWAKED